MTRLLHGRRWRNGRMVDWLIEYQVAFPDCTLTLRGLDYPTAARVAAVAGPGTGWLCDAYGQLWGIALTADEARDIARGAYPVEVLLRREHWGELGYRLTAVPDPLLAGG